MGWAIKDENGRAVGVSLVKDQLQPLHNHMLVEIDDGTAHKVMAGETPLHAVFGTVPTLASAFNPPVRRRSHTTDRYPAMMSDTDVDALANLAAGIPQGATVVEIGSRLGGSARIMLENAPGIKRLYCIDFEWQMPSSDGILDPNMTHIVDRWNVRDFGSCVSFARHYLSGYPCVRLLAKSSPYDIGWWAEKVDFVFEDSSHANPQLSDNIWFWWEHLRSGGVLAGHDYGRPTYPDATTAVNAFAEVVGLHLNVQGTVWWVTKP